ncbi:MAG: RES family NAD+ phosphorylase [Rhodospirillaceae bacterium]
MARNRRDNGLIDALEALEPIRFQGPVWRIVRAGRDPLQCSASGGRWDDTTFDVLYTSLSKRGAVEEMRFHLMRGQPVFPSKVAYELFEFDLALNKALKFAALEDLVQIGLKPETFGRLSYESRGEEYPRSQQIGEVAYFLGFDGLIVPSARSSDGNVVVFCDRVEDLGAREISAHGPVDWSQS